MQRSGPTLRAWRGTDALASEAERARELFARARVDPLCNDPAWLKAHAAAFLADPREVFGWTVEADGAPIGFLPLREEPSRGAFALRRALLSADGTFDSDYLDVAVAPGEERLVLGLLLDALAAERRLQAVVLSGVPATSPILAPLRAELAARRLPARERPGDCLAASLPASLDAYLAELKPRMRSKVRQALRLAAEAGASFAWCEDEAELERHLHGLFDLHARRWSEADETGSFSDARRRAFYSALAPHYLARGELRFARLDLEGRAIAYQIGVRRGATYYQLQEGYLTDLDAFRSATALRALAIERLIAEGVRSYDFLAGATQHKADWGGAPRPCTTIAFALPRIRARAAYALRAWSDWA